MNFYVTTNNTILNSDALLGDSDRARRSVTGRFGSEFRSQKRKTKNRGVTMGKSTTIVAPTNPSRYRGGETNNKALKIQR